MCGLVGIAGKLEFQDEATMKRLLVFDFFRGPDSTGLAQVKKDKSFAVTKLASHPIDFFDTKGCSKLLSFSSATAFIGHNRWATIGKVNGVNAHPFEYGHIVGAHNGTLDKASWDRLNESNGEETTVDSAAIFLSISKIGIEKTIELMTEGDSPKEGAWALVWYDASDNTLNFLRNKHRPFWIAHDDTFQKLFWASEWPMIRAATDLCSKGYELHVTKEGHSFFETAENWWYRIPVEELLEGSDKKPNYRHKKLVGRKPEVKKQWGGSVPFRQHFTTTTMGSPPKTNNGGTESDPVVSSTVIEYTGSCIQPFGGIVTRKEFDDYVLVGCGWCREEVKWGDIGLTVYCNEGIVLCHKCNNSPEKTRVLVSSGEFQTWAQVANG